MRIKNTLYNSIIAILSYLALAVLGFVLRKFFLQYLPAEYLGYEGLFSDIFSILSVGELGINGVILYKMYPAIANDDEYELSRLMSVYQVLYRIVGSFIAAVGLILIPFLQIIIKDNTLRWSYVYLVYLLQLVVSLCTYFLAYKRVMLVATMREAIATKIETTCSFASTVIKIIVILATKNYILYILTGVLNNVAQNALVARRVNKEYGYVKKPVKITREDIRELGIGKDLKNNMVQKLSTAIYGGTDSILISALIGITQVGMMSNYTLISGHMTQLMSKLLNPFQVSIGNFVHSDNQDRAEDMFGMFDRISFFMGSFISVSFFVLYNPFIQLVFGQKYLFGTLYVLMFSINQYILYNHKFLYFFRAAFGKFEMDKWYAFAAAVLNIICSVIFSKYIGVAGIILGTVIGHMGFWIGRVKVVYSEYLQSSVYKYIGKQLVNTLLWIAEMAVAFYLARLTSDDWTGFILKALICLIVPNLANFLLYLKTNDMKMIFEYVHKTGSTIRS